MATGEHGRRMDAIYRTQRHFYDLTRKFYLLGRDALIDRLAPPLGGTVLEVGCGTARNLIAAARAWPQARFYGLDISDAMLATARRSVARAGLSDRITLVRADAAGFHPSAFGIAGFDRVIMSYTLSMIPDWSGTIRRGAEALAPGGQLLIVDFGQQEGWPRWWRRFLFRWLASFDVTPRANLAAVVGAAAAERRLAPSFDPILRGYAWTAALTRPS